MEKKSLAFAIQDRTEEGSSPRFIVRFLPDGEETETIAVRPPEEILIERRPHSHLSQELRWYLENFLDYPLPPETRRAEEILSALARWGEETFRALFGRVATGSRPGSFRIESDNPRTLAWPWEALRHPQRGPIGLFAQVERRIAKDLGLVAPPVQRAGPLGILLILARPYDRDVRYRSISQPLLDLVSEMSLPVRIHVLRPPTLERLRQVLSEHPGEFQILHFDGHGVYGTSPYGKSEGYLVFEGRNGGALIPASMLGELFRRQPVPLVVLNACESARLDAGAENAFASVAASLLDGGARHVVAMAYKLWVTGAQRFVSSFYRCLFETGSVSEAVRAGRGSMMRQKARSCASGRFDLEDWMVPVLYRREEDSDLLPVERSPSSPWPSNPVLRRLIGRDEELLRIERALHRPEAGIVLHGVGGSGKTTLAKAALEWFGQTEGSEGFGRFARWGRECGLEALEDLASSLNGSRSLLVLDGLDLLLGPFTTEIGREHLVRFLRALRGGRSKVILTLRGEIPDWLRGECSAVPVGALRAEEQRLLARRLRSRWQGEEPGEMSGWLHLLGGNPLVLRAILPLAGRVDTSLLASRFRSDFEPLLRETRSRAAVSLRKLLRQSIAGIPKEERILLEALAWRERFVSRDDLERTAEEAGLLDASLRIDHFLSHLVAAGAGRFHGATFEMHPALPGYLRSSTVRDAAADQQIAWGRASALAAATSVDLVLQVLVNDPGRHMVYLEAHEGDLRSGLATAERLAMLGVQASFLQALGHLALGRSSFAEAEDLFLRLAEVARKRGHAQGEAAAFHQLGRTAEERGDRAEAEAWYRRSLEIKERLRDERGCAITYHQMGRIAEDRSDFDAAERWYRASLALKEKLGDEDGMAATQHQLGRLAEARHRFTEAERWYRQSAESCERRGDELGLAQSWHQLGRIAQETGNLKAAERWYARSLLLKQKAGDQEGLSKAYHHLGQVAEEQRCFAKAESWYRKALQIDESTGNRQAMARTCHQMGMVAEDQGDYAAAEEWLLKSLRIEEELHNLDGVASSAHQLGMLEQHRGNHDLAESWYRRSLELERELGDQDGIARTCHQLGYLAQRRGDPEAAESWYREALQIKMQLGDERLLGSTCQNLGILAEMRSDYDMAAEWYRKSLCIALKFSDFSSAGRSQVNLGTVAAICGRLVEAGSWFSQGLRSFRLANEPERGERIPELFAIVYRRSGPEDRQILRAFWREAGLGEWRAEQEGDLVVL